MRVRIGNQASNLLECHLQENSDSKRITMFETFSMWTLHEEYSWAGIIWMFTQLFCKMWTQSVSQTYCSGLHLAAANRTKLWDVVGTRVRLFCCIKTIGFEIFSLQWFFVHSLHYEFVWIQRNIGVSPVKWFMPAVRSLILVFCHITFHSGVSWVAVGTLGVLCEVSTGVAKGWCGSHPGSTTCVWVCSQACLYFLHQRFLMQERENSFCFVSEFEQMRNNICHKHSTGS